MASTIVPIRRASNNAIFTEARVTDDGLFLLFGATEDYARLLKVLDRARVEAEPVVLEDGVGFWVKDGYFGLTYLALLHILTEKEIHAILKAAVCKVAPVYGSAFQCAVLFRKGHIGLEIETEKVAAVFEQLKSRIKDSGTLRGFRREGYITVPHFFEDCAGTSLILFQSEIPTQKFIALLTYHGFLSRAALA